MTTVEANGVTLGIAHFGDVAAPLVLCAGGTTMLSWPDPLCESLARGGRHVVRYDLRDSGASITVDPEAPAYTLRDLAADAAALARELDHRPAHLAGIGVGGMVAQVAALETKAGTGGLAQLHSAAAPAVRDESRSASVASAATRSIAGCYGPMPRRLRIRTCSPRSANSVAVAAPDRARANDDMQRHLRLPPSDTSRPNDRHRGQVGVGPSLPSCTPPTSAHRHERAFLRDTAYRLAATRPNGGGTGSEPWRGPVLRVSNICKPGQSYCSAGARLIDLAPPQLITRIATSLDDR
jgi:pimeloyl-ACP methyl ester carboxylesterase